MFSGVLLELVTVCFACCTGCSYLCFNVYWKVVRGHDLNYEANNTRLCVAVYIYCKRSTQMITPVCVQDSLCNYATLYFKIEKFQPCVHRPRGTSGGRTCSISVKTTASPRKCCSTAAWCGASSPGPPQTQKVENPTDLWRQIEAKPGPKVVWSRSVNVV